MNRFFFCALLSAAIFLSPLSRSAIIDLGNITRDTDTGLEWLDITETINLSVNDVQAELTTGGSFEGWRLARGAEVLGFLQNLTGVNVFTLIPPIGDSTPLLPHVTAIANIWGQTSNSTNIGSLAFVEVDGTFSEFDGDGVELIFTIIRENETDPQTLAQASATSVVNRNSAAETIGVALVRDYTAVPLPAGVWLFFSALIGFSGIRYKLLSAVKN